MIVNEGGGGKKLPTLTNPGTAANLLSGKQLINQNGEIVTGSMTDRGAVTQALNAGGSYAIPAGYHNGAGKVTANSLSSQTSGTATAADIRSGKTAWVNGSKLTGTGQMASSATASVRVINNADSDMYVSYYTAVGDLDVALFSANYDDYLDVLIGSILCGGIAGGRVYVRNTSGSIDTILPGDIDTDFVVVNGDGSVYFHDW